jgi:hypothetical protein
MKNITRILQALGLFMFTIMCIVITLVAANNYEVIHQPVIIRPNGLGSVFENIEGYSYTTDDYEYIRLPHSGDVVIIRFKEPVDFDELNLKLKK